MGLSIALAVAGALLVFATHGTIVLTLLPGLNMHAAGWTLLVTGAISFFTQAFSGHIRGGE